MGKGALVSARNRVRRDKLVRLSSRVHRLEQKHASHGHCALCRDRAPVVLVTISDGSEPTDDGTPCPGCGWRPSVMEVHEVIVSNDEAEI